MTLVPPDLLQRPFAANGDRNPIPDTSALAYRASLQEGFPPPTGKPASEGGVAPTREDFNGIFNLLSVFAFYQQSGGAFEWSASLDYIARCEVYGSDGKKYVALAESGPGTGEGPMDPTQDATGAHWILAGGSQVLWVPLFFAPSQASPVRYFIPPDRSTASITAFDSDVSTASAVVSLKETFGTTTLPVPRAPTSVSITALRGKSVDLSVTGGAGSTTGIAALLKIE